MEKNSVINDRYKILGPLGKGGFGQVYKVLDIIKKHEFALKADILSRGSVLVESSILEELQGGEGIPKLYDSGKAPDFTYMVIELLGPHLNYLRKNLNGFSLCTVTLIFFQCLARIEYLHLHEFIHRDIKPQQFLIGPKDIIYLVDYGISKKYVIDDHHMSFQSQCTRAGSCSYASLNCHLGNRLSRRDDLESLMYMMVCLLKGGLPWQTKSKANDNRRWQAVFTQKKSILDEELFNGCPKQMQQIFAYVKSLKFDEKPDYEYIKDTIQNIRIENSLRMKMFDWQVLERRHKSLDKKKNIDENSKVLRRRKTAKKKKIKDSVKIFAMTTVGSLPGHEESHEGPRRRLPLRKASGTSNNIQDLSSNSSNDLTIKDSFPEFIHRNNIFKELNKFRMLYAFSD